VILLWGLPNEEPFAMVRRALQDAGGDVFVLDQRLIPRTRIELSANGAVSGELRVDGARLAFDQVRAAYHRPYETAALPVVRRAGVGSPLHQHAIGVEVLLSTWLDLADASVVSRPSLMASNNSKPYQATVIAEAGFSVPATLITTCQDAARAFWDEHGDVVYKSVSGTRSIVSRLDQSHLDRLRHVASCPTQLQAFVPGVDVRAHVVGADVFACEVRSDADDYRYASRSGGIARLRATSLPADVEDRCRTLAAALGLPVTGLDLRRTPEGEWFCFEANPSPGFSWYERETGQPIAASIARLLIEGAAGHG
jgi:hypothetical protein